MEQNTCSIPNCDRLVYGSQGWCRRHHSKWLRYGNPLGIDPTHVPINPSGLCACGCGQLTSQSPSTHPAGNLRAGDHYRWVSGHQHRGRRQPDVVPQVTPCELAWAAGIIEGEGSFGGFPYSPGSIRISAGQSDPWILRKLADLFGGHLHQVKPRDGHLSMREFWNWGLTGGRARGLATAIEPYLSPRRLAQLEAARCRGVYPTIPEGK